MIGKRRTTTTTTTHATKAVVRGAGGKFAARNRGGIVVAKSGSSESQTNPDLQLAGANCSIDDPSGCTLADLELMYVDALWNYYNGGQFTLSDEDYDRLREELNWQGSGFPTLRRYEIEFVQAAISYSRGEPVVDDAKYEELKRRVKAAGKRTDVTALLLYTKGKQLLEEAEFELLSKEMMKSGLIEEMVSDAFDEAAGLDVEAETDAEVNKILAELAGEQMAAMPGAETHTVAMPAAAAAVAAAPDPEEDVEIDALQARLDAIRQEAS